MSNYDDLLDNTPASGGDAPEWQDGQFSKEDYAAKKKAERKDLYALSDDTAMEVSGDSGRLRQYLDVQSRFDHYSTVNALLIMAQKPEATRIGDFDYWKSKGAFVKPGQSGFSILEPGKEYERSDGSGTGISYNVKKVFDISQVDTRKYIAKPSPEYNNRQLLKSLVDNAPVKITGADDLPGDLGAMYDPHTDSISVRKGMEFADTFRGVAQELAFADLTTGPDTQADPHFSAYCASYILCRKYGVDSQAFDFADAPVVFDGMDAHDVKGELSQIRDVVEDIARRMARQLGVAQKAERNQEAR